MTEGVSPLEGEVDGRDRVGALLDVEGTQVPIRLECGDQEFGALNGKALLLSPIFARGEEPPKLLGRWTLGSGELAQEAAPSAS